MIQDIVWCDYHNEWTSFSEFISFLNFVDDWETFRHHNSLLQFLSTDQWLR